MPTHRPEEHLDDDERSQTTWTALNRKKMHFRDAEPHSKVRSRLKERSEPIKIVAIMNSRKDFKCRAPAGYRIGGRALLPHP
jgi:hypothetical protein